jgi:L-arabinose transport system ATP-binding protein
MSTSPPDDAIAKGIGFAPEDRKREGLVLIRSVMENASIAIFRRISRFHFVSTKKESQIVEQFVQKLQVRTPSLNSLLANYRAAISKSSFWRAGWLPSPKYSFWTSQTRGIDVGAKAEIYHLIDELANEGLEFSSSVQNCQKFLVFLIVFTLCKTAGSPAN